MTDKEIMVIITFWSSLVKLDKQKRLSYTQQAQEMAVTLSLEEKVYLMSGSMKMEDLTRSWHYNYTPYPAGGNKRIGLAPILFCDGPRGVVCGIGKSTCFPVPMCRGASFDADLEREIGKAIGREVRAYGGNLFAGVCVNLPYNPGWGRSQESYGEDSFALGRMGAALVEGVQSENVMACIKHYAFNSMEISRFKVSIDCERRTEREVFLPHFKDCIDAGAACVMSAYNRYKGVACGHSDYLLRKILKEEWDFDGFVLSDFIWGIHDTIEAANNGQDMEMCCTRFFGDKLVQAVKDGLVPESRINESALRIIRTIIAFEEAYRRNGRNYGKDILGCQKHRALSLRAAREGVTLLQNNRKTLPLNKSRTKKLALIGRLGGSKNTGDNGSSRVYPAHVVTPNEGLARVSPDTEIIYYQGDNLTHAKMVAREADAVVFVVGYDHDDEGEYVASDQFDNYTGSTGGDRTRGLSLHQDEVNLIKSVGPENKKSVVVLIGGSMIMIAEWKDYVASILMAYYPGQEGGIAIAEILFGDINPSGKLPFVVPKEENDLPPVKWSALNEFYGYYHGYTKLEKEGIDPLLPYGFGLSYTSFKISSARFSADDKTVAASCLVWNTGCRAGDTVIQLYVGFKNSKIDRPIKLLRGFIRISLNARERKRVILSCPLEKLKYYNTTMATFELESMEYEVYIGTSSADRDLFAGTIKIGGG
ncbi:MAG: glycoside hydrolase family 3 C-terminal domain-containing protein [Treponema sp.]|nr:glycoside hydrolase family 3 C-terminal domain-containing protein [Treponema sp.]